MSLDLAKYIKDLDDKLGNAYTTAVRKLEARLSGKSDEEMQKELDMILQEPTKYTMDKQLKALARNLKDVLNSNTMKKEDVGSQGMEDIEKNPSLALEARERCNECGAGYMLEGMCNECGYMEEDSKLMEGVNRLKSLAGLLTENVLEAPMRGAIKYKLIIFDRYNAANSQVSDVTSSSRNMEEVLVDELMKLDDASGRDQELRGYFSSRVEMGNNFAAMDDEETSYMLIKA